MNVEQMSDADLYSRIQLERAAERRAKQAADEMFSRARSFDEDAVSAKHHRRYFELELHRRNQLSNA